MKWISLVPKLWLGNEEQRLPACLHSNRNFIPLKCYQFDDSLRRQSVVQNVTVSPLQFRVFRPFRFLSMIQMRANYSKEEKTTNEPNRTNFLIDAQSKIHS